MCLDKKCLDDDLCARSIVARILNISRVESSQSKFKVKRKNFHHELTRFSRLFVHLSLAYHLPAFFFLRVNTTEPPKVAQAGAPDDSEIINSPPRWFRISPGGEHSINNHLDLISTSASWSFARRWAKSKINNFFGEKSFRVCGGLCKWRWRQPSSGEQSIQPRRKPRAGL